MGMLGTFALRLDSLFLRYANRKRFLAHNYGESKAETLSKGFRRLWCKK